MKINAERVTRLRKERQWSQEQLAELCGLNLRTIQRLENEGKASLESLRAVAAVFELDANELLVTEACRAATAPEAVRVAVLKAADFDGTATRFEYWWFFLFVFLLLAGASVISERVLEFMSLLVVLPLIAAGTRRLRDAGHSGWWQLMFLVPAGQVVVLYMLSLRSRINESNVSQGHAGPAS